MRKACYFAIYPPGFDLGPPDPKICIRHGNAHLVVTLVSLYRPWGRLCIWENGPFPCGSTPPPPSGKELGHILSPKKCIGHGKLHANMLLVTFHCPFEILYTPQRKLFFGFPSPPPGLVLGPPNPKKCIRHQMAHLVVPLVSLPRPWGMLRTWENSLFSRW